MKWITSMSIWIPPQEKSTKDYIRWTTISTFIVLMLWMISFFYDEYQHAENRKKEAKVKIAQIEEHNAKVDSQPKEVKKPPEKIIRYVEKSTDGEPTGGGEKIATPIERPVPPPPKDSKIEIDAGLVKVAMSNEASWSAIMKIIFTILGTFFGIRLINYGFKRLEGEPKPA